MPSTVPLYSARTTRRPVRADGEDASDVGVDERGRHHVETIGERVRPARCSGVVLNKCYVFKSCVLLVSEECVA
jgi:hypothetical protein